MSIEAMNWAWRQEAPSAAAKLVLLALADHANGEGYCWPSMGRIGMMVGLSPRQVSNHINALSDAGLLVKADRRRHAGQLRGWTYLIPTSGSILPVVEPTSGNDLPVTSGNPLPSPAAEDCRSEPSENPQREPLRSPRKRDVLFEALAAAGGHRLDRLTATERGRINKATKDVRDAGGTPDDVAAAAAAWRRLYPDARLTVMALAAHWSRLMEDREERSGLSRCGRCGGAMSGHDEELCAAFAA